jgi:hypothetical protein
LRVVGRFEFRGSVGRAIEFSRRRPRLRVSGSERRRGQGLLDIHAAKPGGGFIMLSAFLVIVLAANPDDTAGSRASVSSPGIARPSPDRVEGYKTTIAKRRKRRAALHRSAEMIRRTLPAGGSSPGSQTQCLPGGL